MKKRFLIGMVAAVAVLTMAGCGKSVTEATPEEISSAAESVGIDGSYAVEVIEELTEQQKLEKEITDFCREFVSKSYGENLDNNEPDWEWLKEHTCDLVINGVCERDAHYEQYLHFAETNPGEEYRYQNEYFTRFPVSTFDKGSLDWENIDIRETSISFGVSELEGLEGMYFVTISGTQTWKDGSQDSMGIDIYVYKISGEWKVFRSYLKTF